MGRKLDALLGRNFKTSKFKTLVKLAISRIAIFKNQHQVRFSHARSDVIELLNLGHHDRALLRVEHVIKEQNMVDAFAIMESYCHLLLERVMLIQKNKECPEELKVATACLMFASSRCGEFPELLHIRGVVQSTFGKEFVVRAIELRNNCSVHPKIIQKLSTRPPRMEIKLKVLKEIASEKGITLHLELEEELDVNGKQDESIAKKSANSDDSDEQKDTAIELPMISLDEKLSESMKARKKYRDVAAAAQEAFESAAYAAAAARAAVELSRTESQDFDSDDENGSSPKKGGSTHKKGPFYETPEFPGQEVSEPSNNALVFEKIHPIENDSSESEGEEIEETKENLELQETDETKPREWIEMALTTSSSSDTDVEIPSENGILGRELAINDIVNTDNQDETLGHELAIVRVNTDDHKEKDELAWPKPHEDLSSEVNPSLITFNEDKIIRQIEEESKEDESNFSYQSSKLKNTQSLNFVEQLHSPHPHIDRQWVSMRTRRAKV
ncbi:hypothetical protein CCACVL1_13135 [Corchorus capsularis]|uniref:Regulator of Vps4 activity in the MVB pathway protein n=1 Tax=Corchorus capsularis TaxID=210143 RepID=A0A1R3IC51_COCAP|nr:hypothetical protein CCACVL1_13135 [Corchorus capsularis]